VLAAIGICPLAAISGYPETARFVTERDYGSWRGHAGNRLVRSSLAAVRIGAGSDVVLACVSSSFTGSGDDRTFEVHSDNVVLALARTSLTSQT
jgi:hypothetical protein